MKVVRGRVENGHVVIDEALPEGTEVTVLVAASDGTFALDEDEIVELRASMDEADRGELIPLEEVLRAK